uniref:RNA polymerase II subunit B1 CTD phosphatase RPAP2 homolog n=1 Tax=Rhabditophanes sp. KR3021 TaxID=114890 RepID=A0AC35TIG6_9BILA
MGSKIDVDSIVWALKPEDQEQARQVLLEKIKVKEFSDRVHGHVLALMEETKMDDLRKIINDLDQRTWMNIVEERFLALTCGFVLCQNPVKKPTTQKYVIDRVESKVYENHSERQKFCCRSCYGYSNFFKAQLYDEPLWLTGERRMKKYRYEMSQEEIDTVTGKTNSTVPEFEFIPDSLLTCLTKLKITDDLDPEDPNEDDECFMMKKDDDRFVKEIKGFIETKNTNKSGILNVPIKKSSKAKIDLKLTDDERLAQFVSRRKESNLKIKKPQLTEAKPEVKVVENNKDHARGLKLKDHLKEWLTNDTISFIKNHMRQSAKKSIVKDGVIKSSLTDSELFMLQFLGGGKDMKKLLANAELIIQELDDAETSHLPSLKKDPEHKLRLQILESTLGRTWDEITRTLDIRGNQALLSSLLGTFNLSPDNLVLDKFEKNIAVLIFLRILMVCDVEMCQKFLGNTANNKSTMPLAFTPILKKFDFSIESLQLLFEPILAYLQNA